VFLDRENLEESMGEELEGWRLVEVFVLTTKKWPGRDFY